MTISTTRPVRVARLSGLLIFAWQDERGQWWQIIPAQGRARIADPDEVYEHEPEEPEHEW